MGLSKIKCGKKFAWENFDIIFWKDNFKHKETMQKFFLTRPVFHFHKTLPYKGILVAYSALYSEGEEQLPKDLVVLTCSIQAWKDIKRIAKWGIKHERRNLRKMLKQNRETE